MQNLYRHLYIVYFHRQNVKNVGVKGCLDYYESLGADFSENLKSMLVFDGVIYNEDRHFGNFGVVRDNRTGKIISPASIFPPGNSHL